MSDGKRVWNLYAPVYDLFMWQNRKAYAQMYERIRTVIKGKRVLELCTGTGLIAKHVASEAKEMIASDYAEKVLRQAAKGNLPNNLSFRQVDAPNIPFDDKSFDVVIISNALHIIPDPQKALSEISRVLKSDGVLIAPNFLGHRAGKKERFLAKILSLTGVVFELTWDETTYPKFLEQNGWNVKTKEVFKASFPLMYTECEKKS